MKRLSRRRRAFNVRLAFVRVAWVEGRREAGDGRTLDAGRVRYRELAREGTAKIKEVRIQNRKCMIQKENAPGVMNMIFCSPTPSEDVQINGCSGVTYRADSSLC